MPFRSSGLRAVLLCLVGFGLLGAVRNMPAEGATRSSPRLVESIHQQGSLREIAARNPAAAKLLRELTAEANTAGSVALTVKLAVPFAPEALLGGRDRLLQQQEMAAAVASLKQALPQARSFAQRSALPYVDITLDPAGLARLQTLPGILRVSRPHAVNYMREFVKLRARYRSQHPASSSGELISVGPKVVGGRDADPDAHPFQVGLLYAAVADDLIAQYCGGSLVAERFVVTAAHCSDFVSNPADVEVLVGSQRLDGSGRRIKVRRIYVHPAWPDSVGLDYDVAVWELATPVTGIPFAVVTNTPPTKAGTMLRSTGWGATRDALDLSMADYPIMLQQLDMPFVPTFGETCGEVEHITPRMICAGDIIGQLNWFGDSGGPLTIDRGAGYTELVGIVSGGGLDEDGRPLYPGFYTNVAEASINGFIRGVMSAGSNRIGFDSTLLYVPEEGDPTGTREPADPAAKGWHSSLKWVVNSRKAYVWVVRTSGEGEVRVTYNTKSGTAKPLPDPPAMQVLSDLLDTGDYDYMPVSGVIKFAAGQTAARIPVAILKSSSAEEDETFKLTLSNPSPGWTVDVDTTTVWIYEDN